MSNGLDQMVPNCLQMLPAGEKVATSMERVKCHDKYIGGGGGGGGGMGCILFLNSTFHFFFK